MKFKHLVFAVLLGLVLPGMVYGILDFYTDMKPGETPAEEGDADQTEQTDLLFAVQMADGEVVRMPETEYITGVILGEMPVDFDTEALKAQAVVARTFAMKTQKDAIKHGGGAVCVDASCCQSFCSAQEFLSKGGSQVQVDKVMQVVCDTAGEVLTYGGDLIEATYFSCSGGRTEGAKAVWGSDVPYLQAIDSPGEEGSQHYVDTIRFSKEELSIKLGVPFSGNSNNWFQNIIYTTGGGVESIQICGQEFLGTQLRKLLGLKSTAFTVSMVGDSVLFTTKGYGHRVGMSQYGAEAMAVGGSGYAEILEHYYQGTQLVTLHPLDV